MSKEYVIIAKFFDDGPTLEYFRYPDNSNDIYYMFSNCTNLESRHPYSVDRIVCDLSQRNTVMLLTNKKDIDKYLMTKELLK